MPKVEESPRGSIPQDVMLGRLAQSEQMREFFVQMWLQNPALAVRTGRKMQDMLSPICGVKETSNAII